MPDTTSELGRVRDEQRARERAGSDASRIRRACIETGVACVTSIDTAKALANALKVFEDPTLASCKTVAEYLT